MLPRRADLSRIRAAQPTAGLNPVERNPDGSGRNETERNGKFWKVPERNGIPMHRDGTVPEIRKSLGSKGSRARRAQLTMVN